MIPPPSRISHYVDHRTPAAESPMVLIVDTVAGVVVVFSSHFYARSSSHSVHIFCAKSTSYLFSNNFCTECPIFWYFTFLTTFFYLFIKILLKSVQDLSYLPGFILSTWTWLTVRAPVEMQWLGRHPHPLWDTRCPRNKALYPVVLLPERMLFFLLLPSKIEK